MTAQKTQIKGLKSQNKLSNEQVTLITYQKFKIEKSLNRANKKIKLMGLSLKFGIPIGVLGGFLLAR